MKDKVSISELGMELNAGEAKNKNALAICDKKIQELEQEIKKLRSSKGNIPKDASCDSCGRQIDGGKQRPRRFCC